MKVQSIEIINFKSIDKQKISLAGRSVYIKGGNGTGKSSFIDAIFKPLTGKDLPLKLVRDGQEKGKIRIDLGKLIVEATFNANKEKLNLSVTSPDGATYKSPREMLNNLIGTIDFDLSAFFAMPPKKKVELIKKLAGLDLTHLEERYQELFEERTYANRVAKELAAKVQGLAFDVNKTQPADLSTIQQKWNGLRESQAKREEVKFQVGQRQEANQQLEDRIEFLHAELSKLKTSLAESNITLRHAQEWLEENPEIDLSQVNAEYEQAVQFNKEVEANLDVKTKLDQYQDALKQQNHLNIKLDEVLQQKKEAIAAAPLPVPGLTFDEEQLYLDGLPFEQNQINTAQQIIAGLQINLAMMKDLRIVRFDGSLLDNRNLATVEKWAEDNGLQLFVEMVERDAEGMQIIVSEQLQGEEVAA